MSAASSTPFFTCSTARFFTMFLYDIGVVGFEEPFMRLFNQGMITYVGKSGKAEKMSKSKGNVVNPDELVRDYGCDSLRMYELFVGPPELDAEWNDNGIEGVHRFLKRAWHWVTTAQRPVDGVAVARDARRSVTCSSRTLRNVWRRFA